LFSGQNRTCEQSRVMDHPTYLKIVGHMRLIKQIGHGLHRLIVLRRYTTKRAKAREKMTCQYTREILQGP